MKDRQMYSLEKKVLKDKRINKIFINEEKREYLIRARALQYREMMEELELFYETSMSKNEFINFINHLSIKYGLSIEDTLKRYKETSILREKYNDKIKIIYDCYVDFTPKKLSLRKSIN